MKDFPSKPVGTVIATDASTETEPLEWELVQRLFDAERWYWVATARADGHPHLRPVLAVWLDGRVYSTTSPKAVKGRNLERSSHCSIAARAQAVDIVVEGPTSWVGDRPRLEQIAAAYRAKYGWPVTVTSDNAFDAPYGAPTAGAAPYRPYEIAPEVVYAFGTGDNLGERSTRFLFSRVAGA
jgi:hypothetical protein